MNIIYPCNPFLEVETPLKFEVKRSSFSHVGVSWSGDRTHLSLRIGIIACAEWSMGRY